MNRLEKKLNELKISGLKAFVPYIMAGDGGIEVLNERILLLEKFGATAIEIGIPFSDPVADGPTIQQAGIRSLENGTTLSKVIKELEKFRDEISIPIILMTYMNPIFAYGIEKFVQDINNAGVDGCIIPDLPIEEEELISHLLDTADIELIRLVTMATPRERIERIAKLGKGFLYTVTVKGITGTRNGYGAEIADFLKMVKDISPIPVLAGFGISTRDQVDQFSSYCDGVIVGSKIVELFANNDLSQIEELITPIQIMNKIM
ncbi:MAG: tryptophan synthase subunit alpha [Bacillota bacterium]|nr:tryptophan synthase subunit alpha [Bacillota bacterium]